LEPEIQEAVELRQRAWQPSTLGTFGKPSLRAGRGPLRFATMSGFIPVLLASLALILPAFAAARPQTPEDYLSQAKQHEEKQDYDSAIKVYQQALSAFPDQPEVLKRLGIVYQTELKFQESIEAFQRVLRVNPQYPEVNFYLGVSFLGFNQYDKALGYFDQELKSHPDYRRAHVYAAKTLLALGRTGEAIQHYETLAKESPRDARVWFELASLYRSLAVHAYNQLEDIDPDSVLLVALRAESDADDLRYEDAVNRYEQVLKKQPTFPGVHFALGRIYFKMNKFTEAEPELRRALQEDPNNPPANYMIGQILLRNKQAAEALPFLQIAVEGDPTYMKAQLELGKCYLQLGKLPEAQQALSKAADADPRSVDPHVLLVQLYARLKDDAKRKSELATIQKLEQESRERLQGNVEKAVRKDH